MSRVQEHLLMVIYTRSRPNRRCMLGTQFPYIHLMNN